MSEARTRIFFATDVHASDACFRDFLAAGERYAADVLILGGDLTGKRIVTVVAHGGQSAPAGGAFLARNQSSGSATESSRPVATGWRRFLGLVPRPPAGTHSAYFEGRTVELDGEAEVAAFEARLAAQGIYTVRCDRDRDRELATDPAALAAEFERLTRERLARWVELADGFPGVRGRRVIVNAGNDDHPFVDAILDQSRTIERPEGAVIELGGRMELISTGYANPTPWDCPRDVPEDALQARIDAMAARVRDPSRAVFNFHCPPHGSRLDRARVTTGFGERIESVGSTAVRAAIQRYQPALGLHGHIHESRAAERIGRTRCVNPGSAYRDGELRGAVLECEDGRVRSGFWTPRLEPAWAD